MAKVLSKVYRKMHPPSEADRYFKMESRLRRFCNFHLNLDVNEHDQVDTCIGESILRFTLYESATDKDTLHRRLKHISDMAKELQIALTSCGPWEFDHSIEEDTSHFLVQQLGRKLADNIVGSLTMLHEAAIRSSQDVMTIKGKKGPPTFSWYDPFIFGMRLIAEKSEMSLSVQDRSSERMKTPFLSLVGVYEWCLLKEMWSPSRVARAKRIETSLKRLNAGGVSI
jgi:hypothetical protein